MQHGDWTSHHLWCWLTETEKNLIKNLMLSKLIHNLLNWINSSFIIVSPWQGEIQTSKLKLISGQFSQNIFFATFRQRGSQQFIIRHEESTTIMELPRPANNIWHCRKWSDGEVLLWPGLHQGAWHWHCHLPGDRQLEQDCASLSHGWMSGMEQQILCHYVRHFM